MSEFYCHECQKRNAGACCAGCLRIDPAQIKRMPEWEIKRERARVLANRGRAS